MAGEDALRAQAIEYIMCDFRLDLAHLRAEFGHSADTLAPLLATIAARFGGLVRSTAGRLEILPEARPLTRIIASVFDAHVPEGVRYSRAS